MTGQDSPTPSTPAAALAELTGHADGEPLITGTIMDPFAATVATTAVLAALRHRARTSTGGLVEIPLCDLAVQLTTRSVITWSVTGVSATRTGNRLRGTGPRNIYRCVDGRQVAIDVESDAAWAALGDVPFAWWLPSATVRAGGDGRPPELSVGGAATVVPRFVRATITARGGSVTT